MIHTTHSARSRTLGFALPDEFNTLAYDAVNARLALFSQSHPDSWMCFASAWNGVGYRYRSAAEYHARFSEATSASTGPPPEERYQQEVALFGFATNAIATLDCFFFAAYCAGAIADSDAFPLTVDRHLVVKSADVINRFEDRFPSASLTLGLRDTLDGESFAALSEVRNVLAHRGTIPRRHYMSNVRDTPSAFPDFPKRLPSAWQYTIPLSPSPTHALFDFVTRRQSSLIDAFKDFAECELVVTG